MAFTLITTSIDLATGETVRWGLAGPFSAVGVEDLPRFMLLGEAQAMAADLNVRLAAIEASKRANCTAGNKALEGRFGRQLTEEQGGARRAEIEAWRERIAAERGW